MEIDEHLKYTLYVTRLWQYGWSCFCANNLSLACNLIPAPELENPWSRDVGSSALPLDFSANRTPFRDSGLFPLMGQS